MPIKTIENLRQHLQWAVELEHATLPPYLCALYSIKEGTNERVREVIESVFMEEMLHMTLACNILNAVGGEPVIDKPDFIAKYPTYLPHSDEAFLVPLGKLSRESLEVFMKIEQPEAMDAPPEENRFHTIGQFYDAIEKALIRLCREHGEARVFTGDHARQIHKDTSYYDGGGTIIPVINLESALEALEEIKEQGEGLTHQEIWDGDRDMYHHERDEIAHYFRFHELYVGRSYKRGDTPQSGPTGELIEIDWDGIYNMTPNPRSADYPVGSEVRTKMDMFNQTYSAILHLLHQTFNGKPQLLRVATGVMYELKFLAKDLMQTPIGDGDAVAGPSFEYVSHRQEILKKVVVLKDGPYIALGNIPLVRKTQIISEHGEPMTWSKYDVIETEGTYVLCRCGQSHSKPFCDGSHIHFNFDGTETADERLYLERQRVFHGTGIVVKRDTYVCMESGFCGNRSKKIPQLVEESGDSIARAQAMAMVERCPSGSYTYSVEHITIEPDLPQSIAITSEVECAGPIWITGGIPVERSDGKPFETRNRMTLCRCGQSSKKPLCDGTHRQISFQE